MGGERVKRSLGRERWAHKRGAGSDGQVGGSSSLYSEWKQVHAPSTSHVPCPLHTSPAASTGQLPMGLVEQLAPDQPCSHAHVPSTQRPRPALAWQWCGHVLSSHASPCEPSSHWQAPRTQVPWPEQLATRQGSSSLQSEPCQPRLQKHTPEPTSQKPPSGKEQLAGQGGGGASSAVLAMSRRRCSSRRRSREKISYDGAACSPLSSRIAPGASGESATLRGTRSSIDTTPNLSSFSWPRVVVVVVGPPSARAPVPTPSTMATLDTSGFASPLFGAASWIKEQRDRGADLETLRLNLSKHHRALNEELGTLVEGELPRLVQLTKELSTTEDTLRGLCKQIEGYQDSSQALGDDVKERMERFSAKVDEREALETRLEQLQLLRRLAETLALVEQLLDASPSDAALDCYADADDVDGTPRPLLEVLAEADALLRAAGAFGRLRVLMDAGKELALVRSSAGRVDAARARLLRRLQDCLGVSLEARCAAPVRDCLRAFVECGCADECYAWVQAEWVAPRLLPKLQAAAREGTRERSLAAILAATLDFARGDSFHLLLQREVAELRPPLHLLTHALWTEVVGFLTRSTPQFFGAGIPDAFQHSYLALTGLQARLEGLLATPQQRRYLRAHPATAEFGKRFNLGIYFQLRVQEANKALDAALLTPPGSGSPLAPADAPAPAPAAPAAPAAGAAAGVVEAPPPPATLRTAAALALVEAVRRCFAPNVFLTPLAARFLRLALESCAKFETWLTSLAPPSSSTGPAAAAAAAAPAAAATAASASAAAASGEASKAESGGGEGGGGAMRLDALYFDAGVCAAWLQQLAPLVPRLLQLPEDAAAAEAAGVAGLGADCTALIASAAATLIEASGELRRALVARLAAQCAASLTTGVRAIAASYRMTGKQAPTAPSFFLPDVLKPLRTFLEAHAAALGATAAGADAARAAWAAEVAAAVAEHYLGLAATTLDTVRKNEEALRRLKAGGDAGGGGGGGGGATGGGAAGGGQLSDSHKICVQLCLDVAAFGSQLSGLGVDAAALPTFQQLQEAVRPDDALLASAGLGT